MENIIGLIFTLGLIAGLAAILSYFLALEFISTFLVCLGLFVLICLVLVGAFHLFSWIKKSQIFKSKS